MSWCVHRTTSLGVDRRDTLSKDSECRSRCAIRHQRKRGLVEGTKSILWCKGFWPKRSELPKPIPLPGLSQKRIREEASLQREGIYARLSTEHSHHSCLVSMVEWARSARYSIGDYVPCSQRNEVKTTQLCLHGSEPEPHFPCFDLPWWPSEVPVTATISPKLLMSIWSLTWLKPASGMAKVSIFCFVFLFVFVFV